MDAFTSSAEFYEILSDTEGRLAREGPLLRECLEKAPGHRVVDLTCGTGLHALFYAELGAEVSALDLSAEMVAHARDRRPHARIRYAVGDMRQPSGGPWDLAVCLGNSLCLVRSAEEVQRVLAAVATALPAGGLFLVQVLNCSAEAARRPRHRVERTTAGNREIVAVKSLVPCARHTLLTLTFFAGKDEDWDAVSETAVLMHFDPDDLAAAAERGGLAVEAVYGGFDKQPFSTTKSQDLVCVLKKPV